MTVFKNWLGGGAAKLVDSLGGLAEKFIPTEGKRN